MLLEKRTGDNCHLILLGKHSGVYNDSENFFDVKFLSTESPLINHFMS